MMKDELREAVGIIEIPEGLSEDIEKGVLRAMEEKQHEIKMLRKITAVAAIFMAAVIAAGAGIIFARNGRGVIQRAAEYKFMGFRTGTTEPVVVALSEEGSIIGKLDADSVSLKSETGETVDPDGIFLLSTYWLDENGDLQFTDIPVGGYLVETDLDGSSYELINFNSDDFGDRIIFDPAASFLGSEEEGTGYDTSEGELEISLEKTSDGQYSFVFTPKDEEKYPFSEASEYHPDAISGFKGESLESLGGSGASYLLGTGGPKLELDDGKGGKMIIDNENNTVEISGFGQDEKLWVRLRSVGLLLKNGKRLELHGNWVVKVG